LDRIRAIGKLTAGLQLGLLPVEVVLLLGERGQLAGLVRRAELEQQVQD